MTPPLRLTSADLDGNRQLIAAAIGQHPLSLQFTEPVIAAHSEIAASEAPATPADRQLLRQALTAIDAAEILASRRAA